MLLLEKYFVKISSYLVWNVLISRKFCENVSKVKLHTLWKLQKFTLTLFWQKFRETNVFTKEITKQLIWRNYFSVRVNFWFSFSHSVNCAVEKWKTLSHENISSNQFFFVTLLSRNFCQKSVRGEITTISTLWMNVFAPIKRASAGLKNP